MRNRLDQCLLISIFTSMQQPLQELEIMQSLIIDTTLDSNNVSQNVKVRNTPLPLDWRCYTKFILPLIEDGLRTVWCFPWLNYSKWQIEWDLFSERGHFNGLIRICVLWYALQVLGRKPPRKISTIRTNNLHTFPTLVGDCLYIILL